mmetsp:Transcript_24900/g.80562  ORF Transcript_24900/g.80562 Transcript_24900/m.80562 type:complete len:314 (-) Transcript_24900:556-1497(-)
MLRRGWVYDNYSGAAGGPDDDDDDTRGDEEEEHGAAPPLRADGGVFLRRRAVLLGAHSRVVVVVVVVFQVATEGKKGLVLRANNRSRRLLLVFRSDSSLRRCPWYDVVEGIVQDLDGLQRNLVRGFIRFVDFDVADAQQVEDRVPRDGAEDGMLAVEPAALVQGQEELGPIRIRSILVGHRELAPMVEAYPRVHLVLEGPAPDGVAALPRRRGVPALDEETLEHPVEGRAVVVALQRQLDEVPARQRRLRTPELHVDRTHRRLQHRLPTRQRLRVVHRRHRSKVLVLPTGVSGRRKTSPGGEEESSMMMMVLL